MIGSKNSHASEAELPHNTKELALSFLSAMNTQSYDSIFKLAEKSIAQPNLDRLPTERYASYLSAESMFHGELKHHSLKMAEYSDGTQYIEALVNSKNTQLWYRLLLSMNDAPPYKITRMRLRATEQPEHLKRKNKLTEKQATAKFAGYIDRLSALGTFSGAVLLSKGDSVLLEKSAGLASKRFNIANNIDTRFNLGSMNKMFTSLTVLQLIEQGKIKLTSTLDKVLNIKGEMPHFKEIQIQHLLSHTSGMGRLDCKKADNSVVISLSQCLKKLQKVKLNFEPGTSYRYSNDGMMVLGLVIEKLTGVTYDNAIKSAVFDNAAMENTACLDLQFPVENAAIGYSYYAKRNTWRNNLFIHDKKGGPAGGCYSSVRDLLKFSKALTSHKFVNEELTQKALSARTELGSDRYGFGISKRNGKRVVGHNGAFLGVSSQLNIHLDSDYTIIVLANHSFASDPVVAKFNELFEL